MAKTIPEQDNAAARAYLEQITRGWEALPEAAMIELRCLFPDRTPDIMRFSPDASGIDWLLEHAAAMNRTGLNTYVVVNPVRASAPIRRDGRTSGAFDGDIIAALHCWADADTEEAANNIRAFVGPRYSFAVLTGTQPFPRPHIYWRLDEPCFDLAAWNETQRAIAATLKTDRAVVNPSRIMRLPGMVNWPTDKKAEKGYVAEIATYRDQYPDPRPPIAFDTMRRAFTPAAPLLSQMATATGPSFQIDTGFDAPRKSADDYADILRRARTDGEKHTGVRDLAASLAGSGVPRAMCEALVREACPVWDHGVEKLIDSAYAKFFKEPAQAFSQQTAEEGQERPFDVTPITPTALLGIKPRRWLYGNKLIRGFVSVLASPGGTGKSGLVAAMALDMATGTQTLHDRPHGRLKTWIYNLEDPREESLRKVAALMMFKRIPSSALENIVITSGRERSLIVAQEVERGVIVATPDVPGIIAAIKEAKIDVLTVDPVVRSHLVAENDNKAADFVMDLYAKIADEANCAVLLVHHTRKGFVSGEADSIRGASAMSSAARVAFTLQTMQAEEAVRLDISEAARKSYIRIDNAKANLAPPSDRAEWIKLESQNLGNGDDEYPDGDFVQVVTAWEPPKPWDGIGEKIVEIFARIERGFVQEDGQQIPWGDHKNSKDRHVINAVLASFPDGGFSPSQAEGCVRKWKEDGLLEVREYVNAKREKAKGVFVKNPAGGADAKR